MIILSDGLSFHESNFQKIIEGDDRDFFLHNLF